MPNRRHTLLLTLAALPIMSAATTLATSHQALTVYIGGYAPKSRGIHRFGLDPVSGALTLQDLTPNEQSPSWLALDAGRRLLYSANEGAASVGSYALAANGALRPLGSTESGGAGPVHLSLHPAGRHLFVANYGGATVAVLPLLDDGRPGAILDVRPTAFAPALRPGPQRAARAPEGSFAISGHDAAHAHMVASDPSGRFVIACDLGLDLLIVWRFDAATGRLSSPQATPVSPGAGPRHFVFHPQRPELVYVLNEEASTLSWLRLDAVAGGLVPLGEVSALPAGFMGTSFASGLLVSPDARQIYSLNRLHDSIAIFDLLADGAPRLRGLEWTRGSYPRSAALDPGGRWLLVCNQNSDHVAVFARSRADGGLRFAEQYAAVGSPAAAVFG
ncbi:lactonase family protein [Paucibacter sp. PLA-PC-4]|uniref:lactonase family protein n=1 Tax=Paucibacter sp. PLA-PC-4 TaxID=2993655 RepID=UPI0022487D4D|nr:lactonase family protein [Paucibacter sp. PLA-PC-4]MCX2862900.1 lactonase family protein [Paucibacter sp. PLA-PC-4]